MRNLDCDINNAMKLIEGEKIEDIAFKKNFGTIYPFTNENVLDYIKYFDLKNKSLLTIGSSGDQAINAINRGASEVTILDINPFTKYFFNLKKAALLTLNRIEFIRFFSKETDYYNTMFSCLSFDKDVFYKLLDVLHKIDYDSFLFWDALVDSYSSKMIRSKLFTKDEEHDLNKIKYNKYLCSDGNYNSTIKRFNNVKVKFVEENVCDFFADHKYDNIWLSNVADYLTIFETNNMIDHFKDFLNDDGSLLFYIFFDDACYTYRNLINRDGATLHAIHRNIFNPNLEDNKHYALVYKNSK